MRIVEFIADDLGLDEATNLAIERCHREGVLTGASLMLGQAGTGHGMEVARRNPTLRIGWHFHACDSRPLTRARWPWGRSPAAAGLAMALLPSARELIRQEIRVQWDRFAASGLSCAFINGHHHLHIHPFLAREIRAVVPNAFAGWIRGFDVRTFEPNRLFLLRRLRGPAKRWLRAWREVRRSDTLWGVDRLCSMRSDEVLRAMGQLPGGLHEFVFHPRGGQDDADTQALVTLRAHLAGPPASASHSAA
jgi:chitin disaccharide deacetylase